MTKVLASTTDGRLAYCVSPEEQGGKGWCNHVAHQKEGQSVADFIEEIKDSQDSDLNDINKKDLEAVKKNGRVLEYVKDQTPEICLEAVKKNGLALKYVKDQTSELCCITAVKQNGWALGYVKNQTPEIIQAAIEQDPDAIVFAKINYV